MYYLYETSPDVWHITPIKGVFDEATLVHRGSFDECLAVKNEFIAAVQEHERRIMEIFKKCKI